MSDKPWDGRFSEKTNRLVEAFTSSIHVDKRLYIYDIEGSMAHSRMLAETGIISQEECMSLIEGLGLIKREIERDKFIFDDGLEDIHMHIEARLLQLVGKVAQKLHTARSRNDQVALDMRLYLRHETRLIIQQLEALLKVLVELAEKHIGTIMPGYTHLQRAQPVLLAHHLMAYFSMFQRDRERFQDALKRINVMPLGAAALAGTTHPIDRELTARLLDFPEIAANSIDAVSDRDFVIEFISHAALCMMHHSRLAEELILWSSFEFAFVELPDAFATGSSIMPQKKNPDVAELVRGKSGRVFGNLVTLLTTMKALPLAYNRDMQEDKPPLFDTVDQLKASIGIFTALLPLLTFKLTAMENAASQGYLNATDLADYLAARGMAFRDAHNCAGKAVAHAVTQGKELHDLPLAELKSFSNLINDDIFNFLTTRQMIDRRTSFGGTATTNVKAAIAAARAEWLTGDDGGAEGEVQQAKEA